MMRKVVLLTLVAGSAAALLADVSWELAVIQIPERLPPELINNAAVAKQTNASNSVYSIRS